MVSSMPVGLLETYQPRLSHVHRLSARAKLIAALSLVSCARTGGRTGQKRAAGAARNIRGRFRFLAVINCHPFMKPLLILILVTAGMFIAQISVRADGPQNVVKCTLTLSPEIDCPSCEDGIKHLLVTAHGVQSADIDVLTNKIVVRYDPASIKVQALIGRIAVMGYTAKETK